MEVGGSKRELLCVSTKGMNRAALDMVVMVKSPEDECGATVRDSVAVECSCTVQFASMINVFIHCTTLQA